MAYPEDFEEGEVPSWLERYPGRDGRGFHAWAGNSVALLVAADSSAADAAGDYVPYVLDFQMHPASRDTDALDRIGLYDGVGGLDDWTSVEGALRELEP